MESRKKTEFFFIRHGETEFNRQRIVQGRRVNSALNATGRAQAEALARRFAERHLDVIYCSTLRRAEETAEIVARHHEGVPLIRVRDLEEISWGVYEGRPATAEVMQKLEEMVDRWRNGEFAYAAESGESILDVQHRALRALRRILEEHEGKTIMIVTHGRFLRVLLATLLQAYGLERMHEIHHANTAVNHVILNEETYEARLLNCTAHLEEVEMIEVE